MQRILLDTCVLLWWLADDSHLGKSSKKVIADTNNHIFVSAAAPWEIGIKRVLGKLCAPMDIESIIDKSGFEKLAINCFHAEHAAQLPMHHKDPFDRVMIAQAQTERLTIMTADDIFTQYAINLLDARL